MKLSDLKIGILHSLIGQNDGVSIVIDQTVQSMIRDMHINMQNVYFLSGHSSAYYFNTMIDDVFWHKNDANKYILANFSNPNPPADLEEEILKHAYVAKEIIAKWVSLFDLDVVIAHNSCHPSNFIYAVGLSLYFEEIRKQRKIRPRYLLWWHDSYFERGRFVNPNSVIEKYQEHIPGPHVDGVVFINSQQQEFAKQYYKNFKDETELNHFFEKKVALIPNTSHIPLNWDIAATDDEFYPKQERFNKSFFHDAGILDILDKEGRDINDAVFFLQHTRIVRRKKIETAIDFVFEMAKKYQDENNDKVLMLIVSGHGRDEHDEYHKFLEHYYLNKKQEHYNGQELKVYVKFVENIVLPHREIVVEKKFYSFGEIPAVIAKYNGMGTYFSEVEGFGNNLLEMLSVGLPVVINEYPIYKKDIKSLGFDLISTDDCQITPKMVNKSYELLNNKSKRSKVAKHNLKVLREKLNHKIIGTKLEALIENVFTYV